MSRILHVDDYESWRKIVKDVLEDAGHSVTSFDNLEAAKQAATTEEFDAFVVDGTIIDHNDGLLWGLELVDAGKKVVFLTSNPPENPRFLSVKKGDFEDGMDLVRLLR